MKGETKIMSEGRELDLSCINAIKTLSIDAIEAAGSGHPGAPMGMAPFGYVLWTKHMRHNPKNPGWRGRDRFVLSAGHASMLLYSLLYLTGYDLNIDQIKAFRQLGSKTPGHPEFALTPGVEVTTGPLGQGISNGAGMELARRILAARFSKPGFDLMDYHIYVICSDGDLMEGVSSEACSLAGHLGLGGLVCLYDDNKITIEGSTDLSFTEDVGRRFEAYGWEVLRVGDANDLEAVDKAIEKAKANKDAPSLIMVRSSIACGSPNLEGCEKSHGSPLGIEETRLTKENLDWPAEEFHVPSEAMEHMRKAVARGQDLEADWNGLFNDYKEQYPELAGEYLRV
ncbi:MAG: transketolase, partial [Actinobacteria bacterium]|nr:transketolase [Actinomycetota bacterium]